MKYLDEQIEIQVDFGSSATSQKGVYTFYVYEYDPDSQTEDQEIIFVGNYYYDGNRRVKFNMTDLIRNRRPKVRSNCLTDSSLYWSYEGWMLKQYRIRAYRAGSYATSSWTQVAMIWRYPNVNNPFTTGNLVYSWGSSVHDMVRPALQGFYMETLQLIPHYPKKYTSKYKYAQLFVHSSDNAYLHLWATNDEFEDHYQFSPGHDPLSTNIFVPLSSVMDWQRYEQEIETGGDVNIYVSNYSDDVLIPCGIMDTCYSRYYIQWMDRFGGWQSQPFTERVKFTIDYKTTETQTYTNERNKAFVAAQPKWSVKSEWIKEEFYPYYESMFVSPTVILYDTQEDTAYDVMVTGNWTEKKYKNEKKLLSLSVDLELKTKQNIIY